ncbi:energy transducer TonB [Thiohalomonas denitrificans]|uniref:Protein TonB n=1 Tax=Thiohalomonas denitrificans TaxID=415747 RepID=A0A1G5QJE3_9GAMM|nr:energy transducer TonB [Thiohalomonas denitrificans]SCZ61867.1 protein TonB [Thiohalomonas denitrificans]
MAETLPPPPQFEPGNADRIGLTLFFAVAFHALVILGVTFDLEDFTNPEPRPLSLDITLVQSKSEKAPEEADYLAQADQEGGGSVKEKVRPSSAVSNRRPTPEKGDAERTRAPSSPPPRPERSQVITAPESRIQMESADKVPPKARPDMPTAADLLSRSREAARLSADIRRRQQSYAQRPRHTYISASTRKYEHAAYEEHWRRKVERIGNLNYPEEARRKGLTGSLMLDVAIKPDGTLHKVEVRQSSGKKSLDDAAVRIVKMAAPFAPFSDAMRQEMDILHIIRVWQFESGNQFGTR